MADKLRLRGAGSIDAFRHLGAVHYDGRPPRHVSAGRRALRCKPGCSRCPAKPVRPASLRGYRLIGLLERSARRWHITGAFDHNGAENGVLTAGKIAASGACLARLAEPWIRIPKSGLLMRLPIHGSGREWWIANPHGINFATSGGPYPAQVRVCVREKVDRYL